MVKRVIFIAALFGLIFFASCTQPNMEKVDAQATVAQIAMITKAHTDLTPLEKSTLQRCADEAKACQHDREKLQKQINEIQIQLFDAQKHAGEGIALKWLGIFIVFIIVAVAAFMVWKKFFA